MELLSRLVDKSLIVVDNDTDSRYRLLETVRDYATHRLLWSWYKRDRDEDLDRPRTERPGDDTDA